MSDAPAVKYPCEKHPQHDHKGKPTERHYIRCPWCAQEERRAAYEVQKAGTPQWR